MNISNRRRMKKSLMDILRSIITLPAPSRHPAIFPDRTQSEITEKEDIPLLGVVPIPSRNGKSNAIRGVVSECKPINAPIIVLDIDAHLLRVWELRPAKLRGLVCVVKRIKELCSIKRWHALVTKSECRWYLHILSNVEWWHRRDQAPIQLGTLSPVATHGLIASFIDCR
jgi:hypothetical protein